MCVAGAFDFLPWERSGRLISCVGVRDMEAVRAGQMAQKKAEEVLLA